MKIAVIGAGAIGGLVGAKLALAGEDVTFIVRGANLEAIRDDGIKLIDARRHASTSRATSSATDDYDEAGPQDIVILAMKAHQVEAVAADLPKLFGPDTVVVTMQNGIPYWYFHATAARWKARAVRSVDPSGMRRARHPGRARDRLRRLPGVGAGRAGRGAAHRGRPLPGRRARRLHRPSACSASRDCFTQRRLQGAGAGQHPRRDLAQAVGQPDLQPDQQPVAFDAGRHLPVPARRASWPATMMREAQAVAHKLGIEFRVTLEKRIAGAEKVGKHKTSMLQDIEAGRAPEIDALVGVGDRARRA